MRVLQTDSITVDTHYTDEGYLMDTPILTTVGIFDYVKNGKVQRQLRLPEEVFSEKSLATYEGKPIIVTHEAGEINADNVHDEQIGAILSQGFQDGQNVRAKIIIHDTKSLDLGLRELSLGYDLTLDETPGEWQGEHYDAIQRDIVINHLALVKKARAGNTARLNIDSADETETKGAKEPMEDITRTPEQLAEAISEWMEKNKGGADEPTPAPQGVTPEAKTSPAPVEKADGALEEEEEEEEEVAVPEEDPVMAIRARREHAETDAVNDIETAKKMCEDQSADIDALLNIVETLKTQLEYLKSGENSDEEVPLEKPAEEKKELMLDSADAVISNDVLNTVRMADKLGVQFGKNTKLMDVKMGIVKKLKPSMNLDGKSEESKQIIFDLAMADYKDNKATAQKKQMYNADSAQKPNTKTSAAEARERMISRTKGDK